MFLKKIRLRKSALKVPKIMGGGVGPGLENTQIKAAFFYGFPSRWHLSKRYLKVQGIQKVPKDPWYPKGT